MRMCRSEMGFSKFGAGLSINVDDAAGECHRKESIRRHPGPSKWVRPRLANSGRARTDETQRRHRYLLATLMPARVFAFRTTPPAFSPTFVCPQGRGLPRPLSKRSTAIYASPACFITSAAKSSSTLSMPSPTTRRATAITSAPSFLSASATVTLVSST